MSFKKIAARRRQGLVETFEWILVIILTMVMVSFTSSPDPKEESLQGIKKGEPGTAQLIRRIENE